MRGLFLVAVVASAAALTPTTRRAWTQSPSPPARHPISRPPRPPPARPGGFKDKPIEQRTEKVNINTSQAPAYMDCPGM